MIRINIGSGSRKTSLGVDLVSSTINYHSGLLKEYVKSGDIEACERSLEIIDFANEIGLEEKRGLVLSNRSLEEMAMVDELTGLYNRRFFDQIIGNQVSLVNRGNGNKASLIYFDVDHFKKFNDKFGHLAGDYVLRQIGFLVRRSMRRSDGAFRYGGEEFAVILPGTELNGAYEAAEHLRNSVLGNNWVYDGKSLGCVSISLGVSEFRHGESVWDIMHRVDNRLYAAKEGGRNRTVS